MIDNFENWEQLDENAKRYIDPTPEEMVKRLHVLIVDSKIEPISKDGEILFTDSPSGPGDKQENRVDIIKTVQTPPYLGRQRKSGATKVMRQRVDTMRFKKFINSIPKIGNQWNRLNIDIDLNDSVKSNLPDVVQHAILADYADYSAWKFKRVNKLTFENLDEKKIKIGGEIYKEIVLEGCTDCVLTKFSKDCDKFTSIESTMTMVDQFHEFDEALYVYSEDIEIYETVYVKSKKYVFRNFNLPDITDNFLETYLSFMIDIHGYDENDNLVLENDYATNFFELTNNKKNADNVPQSFIDLVKKHAFKMNSEAFSQIYNYINDEQKKQLEKYKGGSKYKLFR